MNWEILEARIVVSAGAIGIILIAVGIILKLLGY